MATMLFVNLPVKNLKQTVEFFTKLGFTFNPDFTDDKATSMIINETTYVMLLVEEFFQTFTTKKICDTKQSVEVIMALSADTREKVDEMVNTALVNGGNASGETQDHGWMYQRSFQDINGHLWEVVFMDVSSMPKG